MWEKFWREQLQATIKRWIGFIAVDKQWTEGAILDKIGELGGGGASTIRSWYGEDGCNIPLKVETLSKFVLACHKLAPHIIDPEKIRDIFKYNGMTVADMPDEVQKIVKEAVPSSPKHNITNPVIDRSLNKIFPPLPHFFVERKQLEQEIIEKITTSSGEIWVLTGPLGSGKGVLANRIGRQLAAQFPDGQVWCEMGEEDKIDDVLVRIAHKLEISPLGQSSARRNEQLRDTMFSKQVLVVINGIWHSSDLDKLKNLRSERSCLILTTRDQRVARAVDGYTHIVDNLEEAEGITLLETYGADETEARLVIALLGCAPMVLKEAGSYIKSLHSINKKFSFDFVGKMLDWCFNNEPSRKESLIRRESALSLRFAIISPQDEIATPSFLGTLCYFGNLFDIKTLSAVMDMDENVIAHRIGILQDCWFVRDLGQGYFQLDEAQYTFRRPRQASRFTKENELLSLRRQRYAEHYFNCGFDLSTVHFILVRLLDDNWDADKVLGEAAKAFQYVRTQIGERSKLESKLVSSAADFLEFPFGLNSKVAELNLQEFSRYSTAALILLLYSLFCLSEGGIHYLRTRVKETVEKNLVGLKSIDPKRNEYLQQNSVLLNVVEALIWYRQTAPVKLLEEIKGWAEREFNLGNIPRYEYEGINIFLEGYKQQLNG